MCTKHQEELIYFLDSHTHGIGATARGYSRDGSSFFQANQTPSMAEMLRRSQAMFLVSSSHHRLIQLLALFCFTTKAKVKN